MLSAQHTMFIVKSSAIPHVKTAGRSRDDFAERRDTVLEWHRKKTRDLL